MDLIYMSDAMAYQCARGSLSYYDNRSWENKNTKNTQDKHQKSSSVGGKSKGHKSGGGDNCKICQEQRRRTLKSYIRSKSHEEKDGRCIVEEESEEDQEQKRTVAISSGSSSAVETTR